MSIAIAAWRYLFKESFDEQAFGHRDLRLMDKQTKIAVHMARQIYEKVKGDKVPQQDFGIVLLSDTGPIESISEYTSILKKKGYIGVNPSKFPNIMSATALSRIAIDIGAKGPCIPLLSPRVKKQQALIYAIEQITIGRCHAMMLIHIAQNDNCFGCFIEDEDFCNKRGLKPRLIINEKGGRT